MRITWLKTELLHPLDKGGRIRSYHMLRALAARHEVHYVSLDAGDITVEARNRAREYATSIELVPFHLSERVPGGLPARHWRTWPHRFRCPSAAMPAVHSPKPPSVRPATPISSCDFLAPAVNLTRELRARSVLFQHNVEAAIWKRHADVAPSVPMRAYMRSQWSRMFEFERRACRDFGRVIAVSEPDAATFRSEYGCEDVAVVQTGVDCDYFLPDAVTQREREHIVFTGSMDWMPNEDAVSMLCHEVLPRIQQRHLHAHVTIVGRKPSPRVQALAALPGVTVTGTVDDVRPYLARAAVVVVPLRIGGGTRLKIYEALAMDCPVVSTTIGAEGLPLVAGRHYLRADGVAAFAEACSTVLANPERAAHLGATGGELVRQSFGWPSVASGFLTSCLAPRLRSATSTME